MDIQNVNFFSGTTYNSLQDWYLFLQLIPYTMTRKNRSFLELVNKRVLTCVGTEGAIPQYIL